MSRVLGYAKTKFWYGDTPITLRTKDGHEVSFLDLCKETIPVCRLNPFLFNGHLQTIWTSVKSERVPIFYKRRIFEQQDPVYAGTFCIDFKTDPFEGGDPKLPPRTKYYTDEEFDNIGSDDNRPMLVALHGLTGGSYEIYLRHVLAPLVGEGGGWEACVVNSRGCANHELTTGVMFNARATWDVRQAVRWLHEKFPNRPLYGVGFSLGANILSNYVGEEGANCLFKAAVVVSNPWNLEVSSMQLLRKWLGFHLYSKIMGANLKRLFRLHEEVIMADSKIDIEEIHRIKHIHEFDRAVQCPTWGYPTERAYYRDASSSDSVLAVRIPFLALNAEDDPITGSEAIPRLEFGQTSFGVLCTTSLGGHLSWFQLGGGRWFAEATTGFFQKMHREIDSDQFSKQYRTAETEQQAKGTDAASLKFDPMRRKMHIPAQHPPRPYDNP